MSWPKTGIGSAASGYAASGVTTIRWGTDGLYGVYIVNRFNEKTLVDNIKLGNGTGLTTTRIQIVDGVQWAVTVRDDTGMSPPRVGDTVSIVDAGGLLGTVGLSYNATVIESDYEAAPKKEGERVLLVENLLLIESQSGA